MQTNILIALINETDCSTIDEASLKLRRYLNKVVEVNEIIQNKGTEYTDYQKLQTVGN